MGREVWIGFFWLVKKSKTLLIFGKLRDEKCSYQLLQSNYISCLTFIEPLIARYVFYITNETQLIQFSLFLSALYMLGWFFRPSSGVYKTVCTVLGSVMLSCCLPLVWMDWNNHPNMYSVDKNKEHCISCVSLVI
jgi:hypothetical protein